MSLARLQDIRLTHRNQLHFYILKKKLEIEIETRMTYNGTKTTKYLSIIPTKCVQNLHAEHYTPMKENCKELNKWADMLLFIDPKNKYC